MVYSDNCLDFLKQTTQFLGYSTQVLPVRKIGITITLICLAPPLPPSPLPHAVFQFISAVSLLHNRDFAQTFHTIFWLSYKNLSVISEGQQANNNNIIYYLQFI